MTVCPNCARDNPEDARFCSNCGASLSPAAAPSEQRKIVTVVFSDVTGSTALGERLDPETMRRVMSRFFEAMRSVIESHGGTVEKFIGDAVMAVFGIPQLHEDDALRAVRAAVEMRESLGALNEEFEAERGVSIQIRTGVNTGEVVAGGDPTATERLVTGDAVNVAARLEQAASPGEVLIGASTLDLVLDAVDVETVDPLDLKGKSLPVAAYRLLGVRARTAGRVRRGSGAMVGRDRQLRVLLDAFENSVDDRSCHLFTVLGAAGVGKSRLVAEFVARLGDGPAVHAGRCLSYGDGITFWPLDELVRSIVGSSELDVAGLSEAVRAMLDGAEDPDGVASRLAGLLHATTDPVSQQDGFWGARKFFEHLAASSPLVLVIDDIQWALSPMLDLIEHVADWTRDAPILLVCMARPELLENRPNWGGGKMNATSILLEPLGAEDSGLLLETLLGDSDLPDGVRGQITDAADGNPLFVEEMFRMLVDEGHLIRDGDRWVATGDLTTLTIPPTIQTLIAARLDRLGPDERMVVERGSVEGKLFHMGSVIALAPVSERSAVPERLMSLVRKELIRPDRAEFAGDDAFRFQHLLIRDAAYDSMPKATRAELHQQFAEWLVLRSAATPGGLDGILAYHLEQAYRYRTELGSTGDRERELADMAGARYLAAGEASLLQGDPMSAVSLFEHGVALLVPGSDMALRCGLMLGRALLKSGGYGRADQVLAEVQSEARSRGDEHTELLAGVQLLGVRDRIETEWSDQRFVLESERLEKALRELGDVAGSIEAILVRVNWLDREQGRIEAARAMELARSLGDRRLEDEAYVWFLGFSFWSGSTPASEGERLARSFLERESAGLEDRIRALSYVAAFMMMQGQLEAARREMEKVRLLARDLGVRGMNHHPFTIGILELWLGRLDRSEDEIRPEYEELASLGEKNRLSSLAANLARIAALRGEVDEARRFIAIGEGAATPDDIDTHAEIAAARSTIALHEADADGAARHARDAIETIDRRRAGPVQAVYMTMLADALEAGGELVQARDWLTKALAVFETKEMHPLAERTRARIGALS